MSAVSRAEEGQLSLERQPVDPAWLVIAAVKAAGERFADAGVSLRCDLPEGLSGVLGDPDRLGQVLANLLDNALCHTPSGGVVTVAAHRVGGVVRLRVADTGAGVPESDLPHIFERFYRAGNARDRATGGSGIGLTICRAIVEAHGGDITAASDGPGRGTTLTVDLPATAPGG
jgi:two-component system sensor histidine kinase BaeS